MTIQQQQRSSDPPTVDDDIAGVLELYIEGVAKGDPAMLVEAFHPDAQMYGAIGDERFDMPITAFLDHVRQHPADVDGRFSARITSIDRVGDAAGATVIEENYLGALSFTDYFTLSRFEAGWRIVNKTFAHTGGELPA